MNRKWVSLVRLLALAALAVTALSSCFLLNLFGPDPTTISEQIQKFEDALNTTDRAGAYESFDTSTQSIVANGSFWDTDFPTDATDTTPYNLNITSQADTSAVLVTASGNATFGVPKYYKFDMTQDIDDNWMIYAIYWDSANDGNWTLITQ